MNEALLALAACDEELARARHDAEHPASRAELDGVSAQLAELVAHKRALDAQRAPLVERAAQLDAQSAAARERAAQISERLESSTGAGRDLAAMETERRHLEERANILEDEQLEVMESLEPLEARDAALRLDATAAVARRDELAAQLERQRLDAEAVLSGLGARRAELTGPIESALLARYEAVARRTGSSGAARLVDGRCGGCRVAVPATVADQLRLAAAPGALATCDECGRLLVA